MQFMSNLKPQLDLLVTGNVTRTGRQMQLILKVRSWTNETRLPSFLNCKRYPCTALVYRKLTAVDKLMNTLFTASGIGWSLVKFFELMGVCQMLGFGKLNNCKIQNCAPIHRTQLVPLIVTRNVSDLLEINFLLVDIGQTYLYNLTLDIFRLVFSVRGTKTLKHRVLCRNCFHICKNVSTCRRIESRGAT